MKYGLVKDENGGWECGYCGETVDVNAVNVSATLQDLLAAATGALGALVYVEKTVTEDAPYLNTVIDIYNHMHTLGPGLAAITQLRAAIKKAKGG